MLVCPECTGNAYMPAQWMDTCSTWVRVCRTAVCIHSRQFDSRLSLDVASDLSLYTRYGSRLETAEKTGTEKRKKAGGCGADEDTMAEWPVTSCYELSPCRDPGERCQIRNRPDSSRHPSVSARTPALQRSVARLKTISKTKHQAQKRRSGERRQPVPASDSSKQSAAASSKAGAAGSSQRPERATAATPPLADQRVQPVTASERSAERAHCELVRSSCRQKIPENYVAHP
ncbi:hypothetical protein B0T25DRAFT_166635 [Lasiosphaeria hispida]|uniref:Uncharacterized protein n=1 Tax=Lasiosphaeria hispida TaxID=260671 RepID=A0AAJ0HML4_9PEZI|nr:hypothetical protein B0T25DRAFT_166635 [Lasiosphaeria hispida]